MSHDKTHNAGIKLATLNYALAAVAVVLAALLVYAVFHSIAGYNKLQAVTDRYFECQQASLRLQQASDYLTNECRYFVMNGDTEHAFNFFEEALVTRRRDSAVSDIDQYIDAESSGRYLSDALTMSNELMEIEMRAMRLSASARGIADGELPEQLAAYQLAEDDIALTVDEKQITAQQLLFGEEYFAYKDNIYELVDKSINSFVDATRAQQVLDGEALSHSLRWQLALILLMVAVLCALALCTYMLLIKPLDRAVMNIRQNKPIPTAGSSEMRFLSETYNEMFQRQTQYTQALTYTANHDGLTGVYNRAAYEDFKRHADLSHIAVIFIDVDFFKTINDTYGHDSGDIALCRVAQTLQNSFRSDDFVARIGGDEFCVIMLRVDSSMRQLITTKLQHIADVLRQPGKDGSPAITLSIGVAFSDSENSSGDIFKDADTAQYSIKRANRNGFAFF